MSIIELEDTYNRYCCITKIVSNAQERSLADPSGKFISMIGLPLFSKKSKDLRGDIRKYFDEVQGKTIDSCFLDLVAIFERSMFNSIGNASGEIKSIVKAKYEKPSPFHMASDFFVKKQEDIYNLSGVKNMIAEKLPKSAAERLSEILEHRNWLAHGKRIGKQSTISVDELYECLKEILDFVHT
jgi:hypothetical protein